VEEDLHREVEPERLGDLRGEQLRQDALVDRDEEVGDVALQVERRRCQLLRDRADLLLEALGGVARAAPLDAGAGCRR
jgi:hypothetical protein